MLCVLEAVAGEADLFEDVGLAVDHVVLLLVNALGLEKPALMRAPLTRRRVTCPSHIFLELLRNIVLEMQYNTKFTSQIHVELLNYFLLTPCYV